MCLSVSLFPSLCCTLCHSPKKLTFTAVWSGGQCSREYMLGMLASLDSAIGNVTRAIKARGLYNNSVIVFTSDNVHKQTQTPIALYLDCSVVGADSFTQEASLCLCMHMSTGRCCSRQPTARLHEQPPVKVCELIGTGTNSQMFSPDLRNMHLQIGVASLHTLKEVFEQRPSCTHHCYRRAQQAQSSRASSPSLTVSFGVSQMFSKHSRVCKCALGCQMRG